ncbi:hypothetical protein QWY28_23560, partial [Nocardioides sp. SOB77]
MPASVSPRRRGIAALLALGVLAAGCTGDTETPEPSGDGASAEAPAPDPPSASERLGLRPGWGPSRDELD